MISIQVQPQNNQICFNGKSYRKIAKGLSKEIEEGSKHFSQKDSSHRTKAYDEIVRAYAQIDKSIHLEYSGFGYRVPNKSKVIEPYKGTRDINAGFSTEPEYGGEWLKGKTSTPLSTNEVHDCSLLNLVNDSTGEQFLYHILFGTDKSSIKRLINEQFPRFTKANLMAGDHIDTGKTFNDSIEAINEINPKAEKTYFHIMEDCPEIVAIDGKLESIHRESPKKVTFHIIDNQCNY